MTKRRLLLLLGIVVVGVAAFFLARGGVHVTVSNSGATALRSVRLEVTGRSYDLGDIPPGGSRGVGVAPTGESHIELHFTDDQGRQVRLVTGTYFEPSSHGEITIAVRDGKIERVQNNVRSGPF